MCYLTKRTELEVATRSFTVNTLLPVFERVGWDSSPNEKPAKIALRSYLIRLLGKLREPGVIEESRKRFEAFLEDRSSLNPDLRSAVITNVAREADENTYEALAKLAATAENSEERWLFYGALTEPRDEALAKRTLALSLDESLYPETATYLVSGLAWDNHAPLAWAHAEEHFDYLRSKLSALWSNDYFPQMAVSLPPDIAEKELRRFAKAHLEEKDTPAVERAIADIRINNRFREQLLRELPDALKSSQSTEDAPAESTSSE